MKATILFAHGARNPDWAQPILAIRDTMLAREPSARVEAAFLEFISPLLPDAIDALVAEGFRDIVIVPIFMAQSGHTKRDLPALLDAARARHADLSIAIALPIGEAPAVVAAIAEYALSASVPVSPV
ncbi:MAG: sirohydrochlorin chelatase [Nevskiales bacterium]